MGASLKAFSVTEENENTGGIVFAKSSIAARRMGADQYADGDFSYVSCRRANWADSCAEQGDVPISLMVENGWHFECGSCGRRIDSDMLWERDLHPEDLIGSQRSSAYCTAVCEAEWKLHRAKAEHLQRRWIRRFQRFVKAKLPKAVLVNREGYLGSIHGYATTDSRGKWHVDQINVAFEFPGMTIAPAHLRYDRRSSYDRVDGRPHKPYFSVCNGDKVAFEAWVSETANSPALATDSKEGGE